MAKNIFSRIAGGIADQIPFVNVATSANRALRRVTKGAGPSAISDPNFADEESIRAADNAQRNAAALNVAGKALGKFALSWVTAPVFFIGLFIFCLCLTTFMILASAVGWGPGTNSNPKTVIAYLEQHNCVGATSCSYEDVKRIACENAGKEFVDPDTGEVLTVGTREDCEAAIDAENSPLENLYSTSSANSSAVN